MSNNIQEMPEYCALEQSIVSVNKARQYLEQLEWKAKKLDTVEEQKRVSAVEKWKTHLEGLVEQERKSRVLLSRKIFEAEGVQSPLERFMQSKHLERTRELIAEEREFVFSLRDNKKQVAGLGHKISLLELKRAKDFINFSETEREQLEKLYTQANELRKQYHKDEIELERVRESLKLEKLKLGSLFLFMIGDVEAVRENLITRAKEIDKEIKYLLSEVRGVFPNIHWGYERSDLKITKTVVLGVTQIDEKE